MLTLQKMAAGSRRCVCCGRHIKQINSYQMVLDHRWNICVVGLCKLCFDFYQSDTKTKQQNNKT